MKLGFVSAILPDLSLEDVVKFASEEDFACVELMCWPKGKAERRYAGVTHVDVADFKKDDAKKIQDLMARSGVEISGLGYYPNPLAPDQSEAKVYVEQINLSSYIRSRLLHKLRDAPGHVRAVYAGANSEEHRWALGQTVATLLDKHGLAARLGGAIYHPELK